MAESFQDVRVRVHVLAENCLYSMQCKLKLFKKDKGTKVDILSDTNVLARFYFDIS